MGGYLLAVAVLMFLLHLHAVGTTALCRLAGYEAGVMLTYPLWALTIPILFFIFGGQKQDRLVGELSYPIYLVHYIVIAVVSPLLEGIGGPSCTRWTGPVSAIVSVALAGIFYVFQIAPMDRRRHLLTLRKLARQSEAPDVI